MTHASLSHSLSSDLIESHYLEIHCFFTRLPDVQVKGKICEHCMVLSIIYYIILSVIIWLSERCIILEQRVGF